MPDPAPGARPFEGRSAEPFADSPSSADEAPADALARRRRLLMGVIALCAANLLFTATMQLFLGDIAFAFIEHFDISAQRYRRNGILNLVSIIASAPG